MFTRTDILIRVTEQPEGITLYSELHIAREEATTVDDIERAVRHIAADLPGCTIDLELNCSPDLMTRVHRALAHPELHQLPPKEEFQ